MVTVSDLGTAYFTSRDFSAGFVNQYLKDQTPESQVLLIQERLGQTKGDPKLWEQDVQLNRLIWAHLDRRTLVGYQDTPVQGYLARNNEPPHDVCMARTDRVVYDLNIAMEALLKLAPDASIKTHYALKTGDKGVILGRQWYVDLITQYAEQAPRKNAVRTEGETLALAVWRAYFAYILAEDF